MESHTLRLQLGGGTDIDLKNFAKTLQSKATLPPFGLSQITKAQWLHLTLKRIMS